jgi:hypothetical protein
MPNVQNPRGFSPVQPIIRMHYYAKTSAQIIYPGDAVVMRPTGLVHVAATSGTTFVGVAAAYAATAATSVLVMDSKEQEYYIQDDGVSGTLAVADFGSGFDITVTAGTATWNKSKQSVKTSTKSNATAARALLLLGFHPDDTVGKYVRCRVVFNAAKFVQTRGSIFM